MGIENRDYLRDSGDGFRDWSGSGRGRMPLSIVKKLIIVTVGMFILQLLTTQRDQSSLVLQWLELDASSLFTKGQIWRLLSYAFCHSQRDLFHLIFNMMVLWSFGEAACQIIGEREFLWYYLVSAVFAGICTVAFNRVIGLDLRTIGASGATTAVFMLLAMHYPRQRVALFGIFNVELRWLLAFFLIIDGWPALKMLTGDARQMVIDAAMAGKPMTAHSAHLGGLLFGYLYFRWHMRLSTWWDQFAGRVSRVRRRSGQMKVFNPTEQPETDLSDRVDEILAKISREGEASLTARERNILTQASRQLRKDRD